MKTTLKWQKKEKYTLSIVVTSNREPNLPTAVAAILKQQSTHPYDLTIVSPDKKQKNW